MHFISQLVLVANSASRFRLRFKWYIMGILKYHMVEFSHVYSQKCLLFYLYFFLYMHNSIFSNKFYITKTYPHRWTGLLFDNGPSMLQLSYIDTWVPKLLDIACTTDLYDITHTNQHANSTQSQFRLKRLWILNQNVIYIFFSTLGGISVNITSCTVAISITFPFVV